MGSLPFGEETTRFTRSSAYTESRTGSGSSNCRSSTRVTPPGAPASSQTWSPDGRAFAYLDDRNLTVVIRSLTDDSVRVCLAADPAFKQNLFWSADGRFILYDRLDSVTKWDIWVLPLDGSGPPRPVLHSAATELHPALSPDGRWLAYESDESGLIEVYVLPFGSGGMPYQVTNGGGFWPYWTKDGRGLIYSVPKDPNALVEVDVRPGTTFAAGPPRPLGRVPDNAAGADFDRATKRVIAAVPAEKARPQTVTVVQNWQAALRKP